MSDTIPIDTLLYIVQASHTNRTIWSNVVATTGWSGLFDGIGGAVHSFVNGKNKSSAARTLSRALRKRGNLQLREALADEGAGASFTAQVKRVSHSPEPGNPVKHGGVVTIETQDLKVDTLTTTIDGVVDETFANGFSHAADASGNGGGGKLGTW